MTRIGISLGDVTGIGPEVTLKALAGAPPAADVNFVLIGDEPGLRRLDQELGTKIPFEPYPDNARSGGGGKIQILHPLADPLPETLPAGDPAAAIAAVAWLKSGTERCLSGELDALVTAPVNKKAIIDAGISFIGQTELLSGLAGTSRTAMMLLGQDRDGRWLRVALTTTHVAIRKLADQITVEKVILAIELAAQACRDLRLPRARVGVCGLNPHAGEGGQMGTEEITAIEPAVKAARERGIDAVGPLSADALFYYAYNGHYDAVVAMYHDQGLAPLKMVAFEQGINWTLGLPFTRTSPDHGTAYDIAGKNRAHPASMMAALRLACQLAAAKTAARKPGPGVI